MRTRFRQIEEGKARPAPLRALALGLALAALPAAAAAAEPAAPVARAAAPAPAAPALRPEPRPAPPVAPPVALPGPPGDGGGGADPAPPEPPQAASLRPVLRPGPAGHDGAPDPPAPAATGNGTAPGAAGPAAPPDDLRPLARPDRTAGAPRPRRRVTPSCTGDGAWCIAPVSYTRDVCRVIEGVAGEHGLDAGFLARLLWRESLFEPYAISHAGALGIAQFMPGTAALRGLADPFNPAEAMRASAAYLRDLADGFGNLGLAAAAYNGGEARLARFVDGEGGLPGETRAYVRAITGHSVETWKRAPPAAVNYALEPNVPFLTACRNRAASRTMQEFRGPADRLPWAMIYAAHPSREVTRRRGALVEARHPAVLGDSDTVLVRMRLPGRPRDHWIAQAGHGSRDAASAQCNRLRRSGAGCMVLRN